VALGPGDEEGRNVVGPHVVQVAGDAKRLGGLLPAVVRILFPLGEEKHEEGGSESERAQ
jgi:hypothetical protein